MWVLLVKCLGIKLVGEVGNFGWVNTHARTHTHTHTRIHQGHAGAGSTTSGRRFCGFNDLWEG